MNKNTWLVVGLLTVQTMFGVMVISTPEAFGLSPIVLNYLAVANVGIGALLNQIDRLGGQSRQVETVTTERETPGRPPTVETVTTETETLKAPSDQTT